MFACTVRVLHNFVVAERVFLGTEIGAWVRIQEFSEARVFRKILEVRVVARLITQIGIHAKRLVEPPERVFDMAGKAI
jgi:hypothetical protein